MIIKRTRLLFAALVMILQAGILSTTARAADSVDVTFRYFKTSIPTPYLVGEMNNWVNSAAPMTYAGTYWYSTARLAVGGKVPTPVNGVPGAFQYKFYYNGVGTWPNDPLNHHVNSKDNDNTFIYVKDPTIYQFLPNQRNPIVNSTTPLITAYLFPKVGGTVDTAAISITIDGVKYTGVGSSYNASTKQLSYVSPVLPNGNHTVILDVVTNADTVNFTTQGGYVKLLNNTPLSTWEASWLINGRVEDTAVTQVKLVRNGADTFQVSVAKKVFTYQLPLLEGPNSLVAIADSSGSPSVSFPIIINRLVNHAPLGRISFANDLTSVTLHADSSMNAAGDVSSALTYRWSVDTTNPSPVTGVEGSTNEQITIAKPAVPGEYYFNLIVSDTNGYSDTTRNYFGLDDSGAVSTPTLASNPSWVKQGRMYLMFFKAATQQGTISAAMPKLDYIKKMGYNIIWVLPVMKNAYPIDNWYGPGYDIVDFYNVAPDYGTNADFKNFVDKAHSLGMKVILDVTPNHTSKYHPFVSDIKAFRQNSIYWNYYQHKLINNSNYHPLLSPEALTSDSLIVYYYPFSDELLNWNWSDLDARLYMINVYKHWVKQFGVDGYRFDVYWGPRTRANNGNGGETEMGVPVRTALKHIKPDIFLLAEDAGTGIGTETIYADRNGGVDAGYDWNVLHNGAQSFYTGSPQINALNNSIFNCGSCSSMGFVPGPNSVYMRCMENQDEERIIYSYSTQLSLQSNAVASAHATMPVSTIIELSVGLPLVYQGQEIGWGFGIAGQKENRNRNVIDWNDSLRLILQPHYQKLAHIRKNFASFWSQQQLRVNGSNSQILGYSRPLNNLTGLIFSNFTNAVQSTFISLSASNVAFTGGIQNGKTYYASDLYNDTVYQVVFSGGTATIPLTLSAYGSSVMIVSDTTYAITLPSVDGVKDTKYPIPQKYALAQNYPNPFNPTTAIEYDIPKTGNVSIKVYNLLGSEVATIVSGVKQPGHYLATWNAEQFASGVYFYRLSTPSFTSVKKMLLLR